MICKWCGAQTISPKVCQDLCNELSFYTLNHSDPVFFIHQYVVDAYAAQHADKNTKPMKIAFALIGLYLFVEKGYTGKQAQLAHMQLAKEKKSYPSFNLPEDRGNITVANVVKVKEGKDRDQMIKMWAKSVWQAFIENRPLIINFLAEVNFKDLK